MAYQKKQVRILKFLLQSIIIRVILLIVFLFLAFQVYEQYAVMKDTVDKKVRTEITHQDLLNEKEILKQKMHAESVEYGIEAEIRTNFDMKKEGEQVVLILEDSVSEIPERTGPIYKEEIDPKPWYLFWD